MSTRDLQKMVQALPQYSEQIDKLSLHVEVSSAVMQSMMSSPKKTTTILYAFLFKKNVLSSLGSSARDFLRCANIPLLKFLFYT